MYLIRVLNGINEQHSAVRAQIMLMDLLPTIAKVYSFLCSARKTTYSAVSGGAGLL
jgi:hypothetical protein